MPAVCLVFADAHKHACTCKGLMVRQLWTNTSMFTQVLFGEIRASRMKEKLCSEGSALDPEWESEAVTL